MTTNPYTLTVELHEADAAPLIGERRRTLVIKAYSLEDALTYWREVELPRVMRNCTPWSKWSVVEVVMGEDAWRAMEEGR